MSKKDYILIAKVIRELPFSPSIRRVIAQQFAHELMNVNPLFSAPTFVAACTKEDN